MEENTPSKFYYACRNDEIDSVRCLLDKHSIEELDHMEPNGSTALHAACYFDKKEIARLLLNRGFTRTVRNKHHCLPIDEANDEIRALFKRPKTSNRFGGNTSHDREARMWFVTNGHHQHIIPYHTSDTYEGNRLEYGLFNSDKILQQLCNNMPKIDVIRRLFRRAIDEKDCNRLIQAYTAETDFYNRINNYLILQNEQIIKNGNSSTNNVSEFIDTIYLNRQLHKNYQYQGICYRSLRIKSLNDLNIYKVDSKIINITFISTTKDREFAEQYINDLEQGDQPKVIISFDIRQHKSALDIEYISEFPDEKEVLIMTNRIFKVIRRTTRPNGDIEIELRESRST